jgi:5-methyltetrahydrofolate--homocysteine methyltransferase
MWTSVSPCLEDRKYFTLAQARATAKKEAVDFSVAPNIPVTPKFLGFKALKDIPIADVMDFIDWNPFFQAGAYPRSLFSST